MTKVIIKTTANKAAIHVEFLQIIVMLCIMQH